MDDEHESRRGRNKYGRAAKQWNGASVSVHFIGVSDISEAWSMLYCPASQGSRSATGAYRGCGCNECRPAHEETVAKRSRSNVAIPSSGLVAALHPNSVCA